RMTSHDGRSRKATRKIKSTKEQKMKSLEFFKPTLAHNLGLHPSFRSAVAGELPGERNVYMYDSIQLSKTASFRTTSQVTRPNDNKSRWKLLSRSDRRYPAGQLASGVADRVPAGFAWCWAGTDTTLRGSERDLDGHRQSRHRTRCSHGDVAAQRQGARRRGY